MAKNEKELLDELKNFDFHNLYQKGSYIDFNFQNEWTQAYIYKVHPNNIYDISFLLQQGITKNVAEISSFSFGFFTENSYKNDIERRNICFNRELYNTKLVKLIDTFKIKLKKANINLNNDNKEKNKLKNKEKEKNNDDEINNKMIKEKDINKENNIKLDNINNDNDNNNKVNIENSKEDDLNKLDKKDENKETENKDPINNINIEEVQTKKKEEQNKEQNIKEQENKQNQEEIKTTLNSKEDKANESSNSIESNNNISKEKDNKNIPESKNNEQTKITSNSLAQLDKNGKSVNILGYYTFQFLVGFLLDCTDIIYRKIYINSMDILEPELIELFSLISDTIIYIAECVRDNLDKLKSAMMNRKLLIVSQIHAILASFEYILIDFSEIFENDIYLYKNIYNKLIIFANLCYSILIESQKINALPLRLLINLIRFVCEENIYDKIIDYEPKKIYEVFLSHMENLSESELKNIKSNELMKKKCIYIINIIFKTPKEIYINTCYNTYLINCLKCNNLEKKMNALNDINEIIDGVPQELDKNFFEFFIKKNKILDIFFEEGVHEEILKRASNIFKYLASFNKLEDEVLDKLIKEENNDAMKKILCDVISELPSEKKNLTFNHLIKNLNFDEKKSDIEYISNLTESCFSSLENDNFQKMIDKLSKNVDKNIETEEEIEEQKEDMDLEIKENQNYYGLSLLLDYIIKDFNEKKPYDKNNVNIAIEFFSHTIIFTSYIEVKDIYYFMDLLFDNIKSNEKHNSVVQSIYLIKKLLLKLYESNTKEKVIKKLNEKYNIISLIADDLMRYVSILKLDENSKLDNMKIYEGIYPHKINIEERLDIIFIFNRYKQCDINIDTENLKKLYKLFRKKEFKKEMQKFLNILSKNLNFIKKETIHDFYKDIILNPEEFDLINFEDLNALSLIKDLFYKINHDSNTLLGSEKKLRLINQNIEGFDFLFDILINNKNKFVQREISHILCRLCLNLYDYKSDFPQKYWKFFIDKIEDLLIKLNQQNNLNGLNGIINLIDMIYTNSCNFDGVIPCQEDVHQVDDNSFVIFQIHCSLRKHKDYKIFVGYEDTIYLMRWKCGYYFDIPVNNVVFVDKDDQKYNFINDNEKFLDLFPPEIYSTENNPHYSKVIVIEEKDILLKIENNPKSLIETNENLLKILIQNLSAENKLENDIKQKIYNIIKKMPKNLYIEQNIKKFGSNEKISEEIINKNLNYENIYVLSYFLQCFDFYIKGEENKKLTEEEQKEINEFMNNFIQIQKGEELLINILLKSNIDYLTISYIQFECLINLINLIIFINKDKNEKKINKKNYEYIHDNNYLEPIINKLSGLIINILKIKYHEINDYNFTNNICNYRNIIILDSSSLLEKIIFFIDELSSSNKTYYLKYLLDKEDLFKDIFLYNYMNCKEELLIEILHTYFIKHIFEAHNLIKRYLEIMFATDIFKYLIENDYNGNYFKMLTSIMKQYYLKNLENKESQNNKNIEEKSEKKDKDENNKINIEEGKIKEEKDDINNKEIKEKNENENLNKIKDDIIIKENTEDINMKKKEENEKALKNSEKEEKQDKNENKESNETKEIKEQIEEKETTKDEKKEKEEKELNEIKNQKEENDSKNQIGEKEGKEEKEENRPKEEILKKNLNDIDEKREIKEDTEDKEINKINNTIICEKGKKDEEKIQNIDLTGEINKENKFIIQFKMIIDLILEYIEHLYNEDYNNPKEIDLSLKKDPKSQTSINSDDYQLMAKYNELKRNDKIEGIITFLQSILNLYKEELVNYFISKVDIIDLFLNKCIFSKCNINSLDSKFPLCSKSSCQSSIFHLIIFILNNIPEENKLYKNIIHLLSKYHKIGFWKTSSLKNWELDISEVNHQKYIGLKNLSSTCYMNSILQQIFMIPMLRETILSIKNDNEKSLLFELQLLFSALKVYESQYYDPSSFVLANRLNFYEQMDADEYFGIFIDKIESDIKNLYPKEAENKYKDLFRFFFGIKALDELKFVDCNHKRYNEFFYNNIQLEVKGFNNLDSSMKNYFKTEIMDGENKINCEECNIKRTCHKRQIFKSLPNILVINLKRFEFDYNTMLKSKLNNYFEFPFELDMKEYLIEENQEINTKYELTGITIHFGFSDYGHYYDLIKSPDGKWYKFNDNFVTEFDEKDIPHEAFGEKENEEDFIKNIEDKDNGQNNAYILIYKKINFDEDTIDNISKNYICSLACPPYNKFSNISDKIKSIISLKMFKFWNIQSIVSPGYQNFILNLLKYDLLRKNNNVPDKKNEEKKRGNKNIIFEFGLIYFFNIEVRIAFKPKEKTFLGDFIEIIETYIDRDIKKAKYILEEFSNDGAINEYLVSCPVKSGVQATSQIIFKSFKKIFDYIVLNQNSNKASDNAATYFSFLLKFINTYTLYIIYHIRSTPIEHVNLIYFKMISLSDTFINYLKSKNLDRWVFSFYNSDDDEDDEDNEEEMYLNSILNEKTFERVKSLHRILMEKSMEFNGVKIPENKIENEIDKIFYNRNKDNSGNMELIKQLALAFRTIE